MKKIVFVDQCLGSGGAERVMCTVIRSLDPKKYEIHLVLVSNLGAFKELIPDYVNIRVLGIDHTRNAFFSFLRAMRDIRPEVVYATSSSTVILALATRFLCPKYTLVARYSSMPAVDIQNKDLRGWRLWMAKFLYRSADAVIAQTEEMADELATYLNISASRIHHIENPIDVTYSEECLLGAKSPFSSDAVNIVAAGTIYPLKGFDVLLEAFALVHAQDNRFCLHILGRDQEGNRAKLECRAKELGISEQVIFHGFKANPYPYYKYCDLFVLSSRQEAMPNVLLECLYLGKPVVATRCVPVIERMVREGKNGFMVDVGNPEQMAQAILRYKQLRGHKTGAGKNGIVELLDGLCRMTDAQQ